MLALFLIFMSLNFSSDLVYLSELLSTIYKIQRTEADITDYKFFDNIEFLKVKIHNHGQSIKTTIKLIQQSC